MRSDFYWLCGLTVCIACLSGCGQKGPLYMPDTPAKSTTSQESPIMPDIQPTIPTPPLSK